MNNDSTIQATETEASDIRVAIDDGPVTSDFDGRHRGWQASVWLDPEAEDVTIYTSVGSSTPMHVWHNRSILVSISESAAGESVREIIEENLDTVRAIFAQYEGTRWDGNNHVGVWECDENGVPLHVDLVAKLEAALSEAETYSSAGDWLGAAWGECKREVAEALAGVESDDAREAALSALADAWTEQGASDGVLLVTDDVRKQIDRMAEEISEDDSDDE